MMRTALVTLGYLTTLLAGAVSGVEAPQAPAPAAQTQPAPSTPGPQPASVAQTPPAPPPVEAYSYEPQGRRDPFVTVLGTGLEPKLASKKGLGPAGMLTGEIAVRGILQSGVTYIALVQGPDTKTYIMRAGDKLLDGTVKAIASDGLTIVQDVNDPLSLVKTREVRKLLRSKEDVKP
jgi:Tfp pilus assembly protein PilP